MVAKTLIIAILNFLFRWLLSKAAAFDYLISQVTFEHDFEVCIRNMYNAKQLPDEPNDPGAASQKEAMEEVLSLYREQQETLDALATLQDSTDVARHGPGGGFHS